MYQRGRAGDKAKKHKSPVCNDLALTSNYKYNFLLNV